MTLENSLTDGILEIFQKQNIMCISVDMGKQELNFQINHSLTSGVKYMNNFRRIKPIFNKHCGILTYMTVKQMNNFRGIQIIEKSLKIHNG